MSFTYDNTVPATPNNPSVDQPVMLTNAQSIDSIIAVDHFGFNVSNGGYHQQVHLVNQSAPGIGTASGVLYAGLINGNSWPIWQNALGSTPLVTGSATASPNGVVSLAGGIIMQWGIVFPLSSTGPVSFNIPFPNNCFNVQCTLIAHAGGTSSSNTAAPITFTVNTAGFSYSYTGTTSYVAFYWMAIGN